MIASVRGIVLHKDTDSVVVDVQGVGYRLFVSFHTHNELPDRGEEACLHAHMVVRADAIQLYGFLTESEREAFLSLLGVTGIGPRLARNILSGIKPEELAVAVLEGKGAILQAIPGVGKRMVERILLELRGKVTGFQPAQSAQMVAHGAPHEGEALQGDVLSALANLGYRKTEVYRVVQEARQAVRGPLTFQAWVKETLRLLAK